MKSVFDNLNISFSEYAYFSELEPAECVMYLFEIFQVEYLKINGQDLARALKTIFDDDQPLEKVKESKSDDSELHVDLMIDEQNILVESNSLRAMRMILNKLVEDGYILARNIKVEKLYKTDKLTRYLRAYDIVGMSSSISVN
jgi:hypothetical protein